MSIFSMFESLVRGKPKGPVVNLKELEFDWYAYAHDVISGIDFLHEALDDLRNRGIGKRCLYDEPPTMALSSIRWDNLFEIQEWVEEDFIPKIGKHDALSKIPPRYFPSYDADKGPVVAARACKAAAAAHGDKIVSAIRFFLLDMRSPFRQKESLYGGDVTPREVCSWYVGGLHAVERHVHEIDRRFGEVIDFITS